MSEIQVTVVYALPDEQAQVDVICPAGSTIADVLAIMENRTDLPGLFDAIDIAEHEVGVFGFRRNLSDPVAEGDRVEIYRPLQMSPTEARRLRAASRAKNQSG